MYIQIFKHTEINSQIEAFGQLRIQIFSEYPYLYQGDIKEERNYLKYYADAPSGLLVALFNDQGKMVGGATGLSCCENWPDDSLIQFAPQNDKSIFYWGELILLPEIRQQGWGIKLYQTTEKLLQDANYQEIIICMIQTHPNDILRPKNYRDMPKFVKSLQFQEIGHDVYWSWQSIGEMEERPHHLKFWKKKLK